MIYEPSVNLGVICQKWEMWSTAFAAEIKVPLNYCDKKTKNSKSHFRMK